jgi:hypothetical protein
MDKPQLPNLEEMDEQQARRFLAEHIPKAKRKLQGQ